MTKSLLVSLYALRTQVDAVIAQVEEAMGMPGGVPIGSCPKCGASDEHVKDESTIGHREWRCLKCGHEWELNSVA